MSEKFELPEGWVDTSVKEISINIQYGFTASAKREKREMKLLRITDIQEGDVDWENVPYCEIPKEKIPQFKLNPDDILFARTGATTGKSFLVKQCPNAVFASYLIRVRLHNEIDPNFLYLFFNTPDYWSMISENISGNAQPNCNASKLASLKVPLPPLAEQKRIVAKVEALLVRVNAARERLEQVAVILKQFRQAVLAAACSGRLTGDWREGNVELKTDNSSSNLRPKKNLKIKTENLPKIPDEWLWKLLPDLGCLGRGKSRHRPRNAPHLFNGPYPFIQTGDIARSGGKILNHQQTYSEEGLAQSKLWPSETVCITIAANIADSAVLTYPACFPDSVVGLICEPEICIPQYIEYFIRTAREDLSQFAPATAQKNINLAILRDLTVALPPIDEQNEIVRRVEALFHLAERIEARLQAAQARANQLTQSILAKAFRGELVPTEAELARQEGRAYEPAQVLLERIQAERERKNHP